jgi:hypothetical protein
LNAKVANFYYLFLQVTLRLTLAKAIDLLNVKVANFYYLCSQVTLRLTLAKAID